MVIRKSPRICPLAPILSLSLLYSFDCGMDANSCFVKISNSVEMLLSIVQRLTRWMAFYMLLSSNMHKLNDKKLFATIKELMKI